MFAAVELDAELWAVVAVVLFVLCTLINTAAKDWPSVIASAGFTALSLWALTHG